jgi:FKBP-type peptidyl-prolyl cis-trans isomerase (trigger factor)
MEITVQDLEEGRKNLLIEAEWSDVEDDYNAVLSEYQKIRVPGFRPGRAPQDFILQRFRKEILDEVSTRCAQRLSRTAIEKESISPSGPVSVSDIEITYGKPFRFTAQFTVLPEFQLPDYTHITLSTGTDEENRDEVSEWLLEHTSLDISGDLVRQELAPDDATAVEPGSDGWNAATQRVRLLLILKKIARQEGIEVDDRDVTERIEKMAQETGVAASYLKQQLSQSGGLSRIGSLLLAEKTLDYVLEVCIAANRHGDTEMGRRGDNGRGE